MAKKIRPLLYNESIVNLVEICLIEVKSDCSLDPLLIVVLGASVFVSLLKLRVSKKCGFLSIKETAIGVAFAAGATDLPTWKSIISNP